MAGWRSRFAWESTSSGSGSRSGKSGISLRICFALLNAKTGRAIADFIANDYQDQWGDDRARVLERLREGLRYVRGARITASNPSVQIEAQHVVWSGKLTLYSTDGDVMEILDRRINSLPAPFKLEWHHLSGKAWDWKLVRVDNSAFEIPTDFD